jgi:hypothetical protein
MKTKQFGRYSGHRYHKKFEHHFCAVAAISVLLVFTIALLSRAELKLSGELLAAGDGGDIAILSEMQAFDEVQVVRETDEVKLYVLKKNKEEKYLVTALKAEGEWIVDKVEKLH